MYHSRFAFLAVLGLGGLTPGFVSAARVDDVYGLIGIVDALIIAFVALAFAAAVLGFFYGLVLYIFKSGDSQAHSHGVQLMLWGVVALFVMTSIWGLVEILQRTFGTDNSNSPAYPQLEVGGSGSFE